MIKHYIIAGIIGAVGTFLLLRSCTADNKPEIRTETRIDTVFESVYVPVVQGEAKAALRYTYGGMLHDTITERVYITTDRGDTVESFTAVLDTVQRGDTLHLEYAYPSSLFKYSLSRQPIEVKYVTTTITNTVAIQPRKLSIGIQAGAGFVQPLGGTAGVGAYGGIGITYTLY